MQEKKAKPELKDVSEELNEDLKALLAAIDSKMEESNRALDNALELLKIINKDIGAI